MNASFSSTISKTNPNIMEYLAQKLEAKAKGILYSKQLISSVFDIQSFQSYKKNIIAILMEIEDDLKQASLAIKGLFIENKALTLEIDQLNDRLYSLEENNNNYINDLIHSHNYLSAENDELKEKLLLCNNNMNIINSNRNSSTIQIDNSNDNPKHLSNITEETELEIPIKKLHTQESEGSNHYHQVNSYNKNKSNNNCNFNEGGLNNVRNIISDMKNNKKKLKEAIKKHFKGHQQDSKYDIDIEDSGEGEGEGNNSNDEKTIHNSKWNKIKSSEILMKVMKDQENIKILNKRLGKDFIQKMLRDDCPDEYLMKIDSILNEKNNSPMKNKDKIPMRIRNCKSRSSSRSLSKTATQPIKKDKHRSLSTSYIKPPTMSHQVKTPMKGNNSFENTLKRNSKNSKVKKKKKEEDSKPKFNHYLNPYGKYFTNPNEHSMNIKPINR